MNHLVFLDAQAGELEKILSGVKTMILKEVYTDQDVAYPINPGDGLYFLRGKEDCDLRVKATVSRVLNLTTYRDENLSHFLKEMQTRLQLIEDQYNDWSGKEQVLFVEFNSAQKIDVIHVAVDRIANRLGWVAFEEVSQIT